MYACHKLFNIIIVKSEEASGKTMWDQVGTFVSVTWGNKFRYPGKQRSWWRKPTIIILGDVDENNFKVLLLIVWIKEQAYSRGGMKKEGGFTLIKLVSVGEDKIETMSMEKSSVYNNIITDQDTEVTTFSKTEILMR